MRARDWQDTELGPPETWPRALQIAVRIMLASRQPMYIWWGPALVNLYNDAYRPFLGARHPDALGRSASLVWHEIWDVLAPRVAAVMSRGEGTFDEALLLVLERHGYREETYYTFSYTPVPDDAGGPGGVLCACSEDTQRVFLKRQLALLTELSAATTDARTLADACQRAARALETNPRDLPFALVYLRDPDTDRFDLAGAAGVSPGAPAAPERVLPGQDAPWPLHEVSAAGELRVVPVGEIGELPCGPWDEPPSLAAILPIAAAGPAGALVVGLNPHRLPDDAYRALLQLTARQVGAAWAGAAAYEHERERAEQLAELDRAKSDFYDNVSHELRTPLTLVLGHLEQMLGSADASPPMRARAEVARRNALRLLRLVNTLLDFARIGAGHVQAQLDPTDLSELTRQLTSTFESAVAEAGLELRVACPPLEEPVWVDPEMWEKIVLNLVSNAFKFTERGRITVRTRLDGPDAVLEVEDTGAGVPPEELPRLFERFHRVERARGRGQEGSGIGLSLVRELAELLGGGVEVRSAVGVGSTFTVRVPRGERQGAPSAAQPAPFDRRSAMFVREEDRERLPSPPAAPAGAPRILVVDDNADMRAYLLDLLGDTWRVTAVDDGEAALRSALDDPPDLVLSDIAMPRRTGISLLSALRADDRTRAVPVILLSARGSVDAVTSGIEAGADDYVTKPFAARELLARIGNQLTIARLRREALLRLDEARQERDRAIEEERSRLLAVFTQAPAFLAVLRGPTHVFELTNEPYQRLIGDRPLLGLAVREAVPEAEGQGFFEELDAVYRTGEPYHATGARIMLSPGPGQPLAERFVDFVYSPLREADGTTVGVLASGFDITERVRAVQAVEESERRYRFLVEMIPQIVWTADPDGRLDFYSARWTEYTGRTSEQTVAGGWEGTIPAEELPAVAAAWRRGVETGTPVEVEHRTRGKDGVLRWFLTQASPLRDESGQIVKWIGTSTDIEDAKTATARLHQAERMQAVGKLAGGVAHEINNMMTAVIGFGDLALRRIDPQRPERRDITEMLKAANRAAGVSRQLLAYSRQQMLQPIVLDVAEVVRELEPTLARLMGADKRLDVRLPGGPAVVRADRGQLEQVLINLVSNARDALAPGGRVEVCVSEAEIDRAQALGAVERVEPGTYARISVRDDGSGMDAHTLAHLFEPFFTTKPFGQGTGLGLATVHGIVKQSGGEIGVDSAVGRGTTIDVVLPVVAGQPVEEPAAERHVDGGPASVLVVEDEDILREMVRRVLEGSGYRVHAAPGGRQALDLLEAHAVDLVVSDVVMPGMSGKELGERLAHSHPSLPVLYMSGYAGSDVVERGLVVSDAPFLQKPFSPTDLVARVSQLLEERRRP